MRRERDSQLLWTELFESNALPSALAELARVLHSAPWARERYPWVSHRRLMLSRDAPLDGIRNGPSVGFRYSDDGSLIVDLFVKGCLDEHSSTVFATISEEVEALVRPWLS